MCLSNSPGGGSPEYLLGRGVSDLVELAGDAGAWAERPFPGFRVPTTSASRHAKLLLSMLVSFFNLYPIRCGVMARLRSSVAVAYHSRCPPTIRLFGSQPVVRHRETPREFAERLAKRQEDPPNTRQFIAPHLPMFDAEVSSGVRVSWFVGLGGFGSVLDSVGLLRLFFGPNAFESFFQKLRLTGVFVTDEGVINRKNLPIF